MIKAYLFNGSHIYLEGVDQDRVVQALHQYGQQLGHQPVTMSPQAHPKTFRQITDEECRLYWVSPQLRSFVGIHEFRYYQTSNHRTGYLDVNLALFLSAHLACHVLAAQLFEEAGFWGMIRLDRGEKIEELNWERYGSQSTAQSQLAQRVGDYQLANWRLPYEFIPGPMVSAVADIPQSADTIEGYEEFQHVCTSVGPLPEIPLSDMPNPSGCGHF